MSALSSLLWNRWKLEFSAVDTAGIGTPDSVAYFDSLPAALYFMHRIVLRPGDGARVINRSTGHVVAHCEIRTDGVLTRGPETGKSVL